jgi:hypothetical protein
MDDRTTSATRRTAFDVNLPRWRVSSFPLIKYA